MGIESRPADPARGFGEPLLDDDFFAGGEKPKGSSELDDFFGGGGATASFDEGRSRADPGIDKAFELAAINPLVGAAAPLLWLAGRLNESAPPDDVAEFRNRTIDEIKRFETAAMARDISARTARVARYALCATIDDIILNTKWGGQSGWASGGLVSMLYNETWGGERFYDLLSQTMLNPEENIDVLELMAICLAIGFVGKYRVMEGGQGHLTRLRHELYRVIRRVRGPYERSLSPAWQGVAAPHKPPRSMAAPWLAALVVLGLLAVLWIFSSVSLRSSVEATAEQISGLVPPVPVTADRAAIPSIPDPVPPVRQTQVERLSEFLAEDIAAGAVEVAPLGDDVAIRMLRAAFPSGGLALSSSEEPLVRRIGAALDGERGPILVIGHTDNVPVGANNPMGDNMAISVARAESAADMLRRYVAEPSRVSSEGRGEGDPIASNATAEGRARNRRVEFQIPAEAAQ
ncbi:type IVB secretion system protein IcmH/DotU [Mesorhizobium sp. CAU 1741]|uniref:type IVB secretion system protein IcmH/DotU n=1 Tax=Mesorhizobium sp. CAU 1741 TaxID=3140366 RepID=UPI00325A740F